MSEEKQEKDTGKKQKNRLLTFTTVIVISIVTMIVVLMETTGLGTGTLGSPSLGSTTTTIQGDGSGSLGDANTVSGLPKEETYSFRQNDIYNGTLLLVDSTHLLRSSSPSTELDLYADVWRKDADGNILYHVRGSARKKLEAQAADAFVALVRAYHNAVDETATLELRLSAYDDTTVTAPQ